MIDLHHHLLPAIDDGPTTVADSLAAAEFAASEGIRTIVATPHLREDHPRVHPRALSSQCAELSEHLAQRGVDIQVVPGGEVSLGWAHEASDEDLRLVSYGQRGTDLLVETPYGPLTSTFEELLFGIELRGYRILLAHPERNPTFQAESARLAALVERGALIQVSANALTTARKNSQSRRLALWLVDRGMAHIIASDAHGLSARPWSLSAAVTVAAGRVGEAAQQMVTASPAAILAGEPLPVPPTRPLKWTRLFPQ